MKIKAILCDFDGTLVDTDVKYQPEIKPLIKKIQDKGVRFSLATGRAYYSAVGRIENELKIQGIHILHGGAMIFDSIRNMTFFLQAIPDETVRKITDYFSDHGLVFSMEAQKHAYVSKRIKGSLHYPDITNQKLSEHKTGEPILKMVIWAKANGLDETKIDKYLSDLQKICPDVSLMKFNINNFFGTDITSEKATKHTAVLEYLKILNLVPEEVVAIGDGHNDYPLFTACGFGIAMATSPKELKEIAGLVVPSVVDGGMVEALRYIDGNLT